VKLLLASLGGAIPSALVARTWARVSRRFAADVDAADAIVVFGAEVYEHGPSPELRARLEHAAALYRNGYAPTIVCSGGISRGLSEPEIMRSALSECGIPPTAVLVDESGSSTRRTIAAARRHATGPWRRVVLVSSPYHMYRIVGEARRQRLDGMPSAAFDTPITRRRIARVRQELREVLAVWWYAVTAHLDSSGVLANPLVDDAVDLAAAAPTPRHSVPDHANRPEEWFQQAVVENWRYGQALVPSSWL
jgi:uncharacterized SAM-binding protein YcdF (DUF218 family)